MLSKITQLDYAQSPIQQGVSSPPPPRIIRVPDAAKNIKKFEKHVGLREGQQVKIQTSRPNREQFDGYLGWVAGFNPSTEVVHVAIDHLTVVFYADELLPFEFQEVGV